MIYVTSSHWDSLVFMNMKDNNLKYGSKITIRIEELKYQELYSLTKAHKITVTDLLRGLLDKVLDKHRESSNYYKLQ